MQIIVPMSGVGQRFREEGYQIPKPLIFVDGKPIISHVIDLFPGESKFTFICNREHLENPRFEMRAVLECYSPSAEIVAIDPHRAGPVFAVSKVFERLNPEEPIIVNYCDFGCYWDYLDFKAFLQQTDCDGCIPAYRGFHPHMLGTTNYAFMREQNLWVQDIQEKQPFTKDRQQEFASSGTYYFKSAAMMQKYFEMNLRNGPAVNSEYYVSLAYKAMLADNLSVAVYELQNFMQWGTPEDLREYQYWSSVFRDLGSSDTRLRRSEVSYRGTLIIPMAGAGSRFVQAGYQVPKPLIEVSGRPMVVQAAQDLPTMDRQVFVVRKDLPGIEEVKGEITKAFPQAQFPTLEKLSDGQARSCLFGLSGVPMDQPLMIGACDNGVIYDAEVFDSLMADENTDVIVWVARAYPGAIKKPHMYGWVEISGQSVKRVSVKVPLSDPFSDPIVIGAFTFKRASDFIRAVERLIESGVRVNNELYVDSCINDAIALGLNVKIFEVKQYLCWGTPDDLRCFEYWQSCFNKWQGHPYQLELDHRVCSSKTEELKNRYRPSEVARPGGRPV